MGKINMGLTDLLCSSRIYTAKMIALVLSLMVAGAAADCALDIQSCMNAFNTKIKAVQNNIVESCQAGDDFLSCLRTSEADPGCAPRLDEIKSQIADATTKLTASGCNPSGGADACLTGIQHCEDVLHNDMKTVNRDSHDDQCRVAADFLKCLTGIGCSGPNKSKVHDSITKVMHDETLAHCV